MTTMPIADFLRELEPVLRGEGSRALGPETMFRELPAWDSVAVLAVLAAVDSCFGVQISAAELNRCQTLEEVYRLATAKAA